MSGLEIIQNRIGETWCQEEVEARLRGIMKVRGTTARYSLPWVCAAGWGSASCSALPVFCEKEPRGRGAPPKHCSTVWSASAAGVSCSAVHAVHAAPCAQSIYTISKAAAEEYRVGLSDGANIAGFLKARAI